MALLGVLSQAYASASGLECNLLRPNDSLAQKRPFNLLADREYRAIDTWRKG